MKFGAGLLILSLFLTGCMTKKSSNLASGDRVSPTYAGPAETASCSTSVTYTDPVTFTGTATYIRRNVWTSGSDGGLGGATTASTHPATEHAIRGAEVRVTDAAGKVVQCADTGTGSFSLTLPRGNTNYTVSVNSRANNANLYASVLNQPEKNQFYSIKWTVNANANSSYSFTATADGELTGAAFNILDQIYEANVYLRTNTAACTNSCKQVTASLNELSNAQLTGRVPKVTAYWTKGYNPNSYFGGTGGLSFYLPGYSRLFILGGQNGDVNSADTDHFDDSVIIHEYGHFLEDVIGVSDSPGGSHTGTKMIDPRLAWSEGWGNFFQAAVRNDAHYIDTIGNDDGITDLAFYVDLETVRGASGYDYPTQMGEGNFREFSVSRMLWDVIDSAQDFYMSGITPSGSAETVANEFHEIWSSFSSVIRGFPYSNYGFRSIGLLQEIQPSLTSSSSWASARSVNMQDGDTSEYGRYVSTSGSCSATPFTITPVTASGDDGSFSKSDLLNNNDFYYFKAPSAGSYTFTLAYAAPTSGQAADLDFYVYKEEYTFGSSASWLGYSRKSMTATDPYTETTAAITLAAGQKVMLNAFVFTGNGPGVAASYALKVNGSNLCPSSIVPP